MKGLSQRYAAVIGLPLIAFMLCCCGFSRKHCTEDYGVFLGLGPEDMDQMEGYQTVVVDAQYFSGDEIAELKEQGSCVYSYLNIGSLENFRDYYPAYSALTLGDYENWDEERWIDVASPAWQEFLISLEEELLSKNIDGFFIDNCDVYCEYPSEEIFYGLNTILEHIMQYDKPVIINGGDVYVSKYRTVYGSSHRIMTGVNQECVFSKIDFETGTFSTQTKADRDYFQSYLEACKKEGMDVYLLEYTTEDTLKKQIEKYSTENQFYFYFAESIELDGRGK